MDFDCESLLLSPSLALKATCECIPSAFSAAAGAWSILSVQDLRVGRLCWPEEAALRIAVSSSASEPSLQEHPRQSPDGCCVHALGLPGAGASLSFSSLEIETPIGGVVQAIGFSAPRRAIDPEHYLPLSAQCLQCPRPASLL